LRRWPATFRRCARCASIRSSRYGMSRACAEMTTSHTRSTRPSRTKPTGTVIEERFSPRARARPSKMRRRNRVVRRNSPRVFPSSGPRIKSQCGVAHHRFPARQALLRIASSLLSCVSSLRGTARSARRSRATPQLTSARLLGAIWGFTRPF
jgi:hypothetical protein